MLGRQFDRTFHTDEVGKTTLYGPEDLYGNYDPAGMVKETGRMARGQSYQGMLFSPHVGTGEGGDPAVFTRDRAEQALGTSVGRLTARRRNPLTPDQAEAEVGALTGELARTSMPPHVMDALAATKVHTRINSSGERSNYDSGIVTINHMRGRPDVSALTHELGHALDPHVQSDALDQRAGRWLKQNKDGHWMLQANRPDPRGEGVADGFADRFQRLASSQVAPGEVADMHTKGVDIHSYGSGFSGFKDKASKAAYSAVRAHTAAGDLHAAEAIPSREDLLVKAGMGPSSGWQTKTLQVMEKKGRSVRWAPEWVTGEDQWRNEMIDKSTGNSMLVGHLAHEHPHVQPVLEAGGFGKEMQKGLSLYREKFPPVPHAVELSMGDQGALSRTNHGKMRQARALDSLAEATESERPNTQTETLF